MTKLNPVIQKLTKSRASKNLPILTRACVVGGRVFTTDLATWASQPVPPSLEVGVYIIANNELLKKTDDEIGDFPQPPDFDRPESTFLATVNGKDLKFLFKGSSADQTRYVLNGICFDGEYGVSTDGRMLNRLTLTQFSESEEPVIVHRDMCKLVPARKNVTATFRHDTIHDLVSIEFDGVSLVCRAVQGSYPKWRHVIPELSTGNSTGVLCYDDLKAEKAVQIAEGQTKDSANLKFSPVKGYTISDYESRPRMTVIMPLRGKEDEPTTSKIAIRYLESMDWDHEPFFHREDNPYSPHICYTNN